MHSVIEQNRTIKLEILLRVDSRGQLSLGTWILFALSDYDSPLPRPSNQNQSSSPPAGVNLDFILVCTFERSFTLLLLLAAVAFRLQRVKQTATILFERFLVV